MINSDMTQAEFSQLVSKIKENLARIESEMAEAAKKSGREVEDVKLIAVTKQVPLETIRAGIEAGIHRFGENYPEQAAEKISALAGDQGLEWHMIGNIQSRKTETVCQYFDMVHSLDRIKIANRLDRHCRAMNKILPVLAEVNISGEESKHGWPAWRESQWGDLVKTLREIAQLSHIRLVGLMTMPPFFEEPQKTRPYYQQLLKLRDYLKNEMPDIDWKELSIGTSFDYKIAIEEGATMVRVGTEIFGAR